MAPSKDPLFSDSTASSVEAVIAYKTVLKAVLDRRPAGFRAKLAAAIGRNPSFVSQITNPAYPVPIPVQHLDRIFEICHMAPPEKTAFLEAYGRAHPGRIKAKTDAKTGKSGPHRQVVLSVPDLGTAEANRKFDSALREFIRRLAPLMRTGDETA